MMVGITGLLLAALPGATLQGTSQSAAGDQRLELAASPTPQTDAQGGAPAASAPAASVPAPAPSGDRFSGFDGSARQSLSFYCLSFGHSMICKDEFFKLNHRRQR